MNVMELEVVQFLNEKLAERANTLNMQSYHMLMREKMKQMMTPPPSTSSDPSPNTSRGPSPVEPSTSRPASPVDQKEEQPTAIPESVALIGKAKMTILNKLVYPTSLTPEPSCDESCDESSVADDEPINYTVKSRKSEEFDVKSRSEFIKLKEQPKDKLKTPSRVPEVKVAPKVLMKSESKEEDKQEQEGFNPLKLSAKTATWNGASIYTNMPARTMLHYDKLLKSSHKLKVNTLRTLNKLQPVSYEYNPKKSRIRTNYSDPQTALERTTNNIASRRSRQRKKFQNTIIQYSLDYDEDENFLLAKQEAWLLNIINGIEGNVLSSGDSKKIAELSDLRQKCGFQL